MHFKNNSDFYLTLENGYKGVILGYKNHIVGIEYLFRLKYL
jgi:hypothetical protein